MLLLSIQIPRTGKMSWGEAARASLQAKDLPTNQSWGFQTEIAVSSHWSRHSVGIWASFNGLGFDLYAMTQILSQIFDGSFLQILICEMPAWKPYY